MARGIIASFLGMFVMACSGCGGGGGGSGAAPQQAQATPAPKPVTIDAEGDSTMYGGQRSSPNSTPYQTSKNAPADLQALFGAGITVVNSGVLSASIADNLAGGNQYYAQPFTTRLAAMSAQIVIENYAINDMQQVTTDVFQTELTQWVNDVRAAGKTAILEEPNPVCRAGLPDLQPYVAVIDQVAQSMNAPLVQQWAYIQTLPNWCSMMQDQVHPDDALYAIKAQREYDVLAPIVKSLQGGS